MRLKRPRATPNSPSNSSLTQEEVATKVGKSRAVVANALRLLKLAPPIQAHIRQGRLSVGHAKVLLGLPTDSLQQLAAARVLKDGLNVRQTEALAAHLQARETGTRSQPVPPAQSPRKAQTADLEDRLRQRLGTKVRLRYLEGKGALEISFFSDPELEAGLLEILGVKVEGPRQDWLRGRRCPRSTRSLRGLSGSILQSVFWN